MADNNTLARPYAQALFDLASASDALGEWSAALAVAGQVAADEQAAQMLGNPKLSDAQRLNFLTDLFRSAGPESALLSGQNAAGSNFLKLLIENDRTNVLPEISEHFEALKAEVENSVDVTVTAAAPLSDAQMQTISASLRKRLGREVRLQTKIDESLIGGAVIRAGDVVIDGSLRARLEGLANALAN